MQLYLFKGFEKIACPMPELPPAQRWTMSDAVRPTGSALPPGQVLTLLVVLLHPHSPMFYLGTASGTFFPHFPPLK